MLRRPLSGFLGFLASPHFSGRTSRSNMSKAQKIGGGFARLTIRRMFPKAKMIFFDFFLTERNALVDVLLKPYQSESVAASNKMNMFQESKNTKGL